VMSHQILVAAAEPQVSPAHPPLAEECRGTAWRRPGRRRRV